MANWPTFPLNFFLQVSQKMLSTFSIPWWKSPKKLKFKGSCLQLTLKFFPRVGPHSTQCKPRFSLVLSIATKIVPRPRFSVYIRMVENTWWPPWSIPRTGPAGTILVAIESSDFIRPSRLVCLSLPQLFSVALFQSYFHSSAAAANGSGLSSQNSHQQHFFSISSGFRSHQGRCSQCWQPAQQLNAPSFHRNTEKMAWLPNSCVCIVPLVRGVHLQIC